MRLGFHCSEYHNIDYVFVQSLGLIGHPEVKTDVMDFKYYSIEMSFDGYMEIEARSIEVSLSFLHILELKNRCFNKTARRLPEVK